MVQLDGALARKLDFGDMPTNTTSTVGRGRAGLRLAPRPPRAAGPDKYRLLEVRRRQAQMRARRLLDGLDAEQ